MAPTNKNKEVAEGLLASHPDKNCVYFTSDSFAFFEKQNAESHAHSLEDKSLDAHAREVLHTSSLLDDEDDQDEVTDIVTEQTLADNPEMKAQGFKVGDDFSYPRQETPEETEAAKAAAKSAKKTAPKK